MKKELLNRAEKELTELFRTGKIEAGKALSEKIENITKSDFYLNNKVYPGYNIHNLNFETVFGHLNPGGDPSPAEFKKEFIDTCNDEKEFFSN